MREVSVTLTWADFDGIVVALRVKTSMDNAMSSDTSRPLFVRDMLEREAKRQTEWANKIEAQLEEKRG
jgi:hypothetical protein